MLARSRAARGRFRDLRLPVSTYRMAHNEGAPNPTTVSTGELFARAHATYLHATALVKEGHADSLDALPATVQADIEEARACLLVCADRGHAKSSFILAEMAEEGCGEEQDDEKALKLYERAALQGDADAQLAYADKLGNVGRGPLHTNLSHERRSEHHRIHLWTSNIMLTPTVPTNRGRRGFREPRLRASLHLLRARGSERPR